MADESTPLTAPGPAYVFPGGVSPRSRRNKMWQFQWCMGVTLFAIVVTALLFALWLSEPYSQPSPVLSLLTNETPHALNASEIRALLESNVPLPDEPETDWALKNATTHPLQPNHAVDAGIKDLGDREIFEESLVPITINTPAYRHFRSISTTSDARKVSRRGIVETQATSHIAEKLNYTKYKGRNNIGRGPQINLPDPTLNFICNFNSPYRRANGVCNNKLHPRGYGAAMIPFRRMVAPDYADGISLPRESHTGRLPPAREISLKIYRPTYATDSNFTVMLAVFGQFLDHDITATALSTTQEGESIDCCKVALSAHPECFPVKILEDDPFHIDFNVTCMNFVRSAPAPTGHFGPRQQLNQATAFIDGSVVYGNSDSQHKGLRTMVNGTLRMFTTSDGRELLPISTDPNDGCNQVEMIKDGKYCFETGDNRANENLHLTSMHLLWARHHNFLATGLQQVNPDWDDETLFQETRRILSAQLAHITYNEFLPVLLGRDFAAKKGLLPLTEEEFDDASDTYDETVDPTIANSFAASAFRFAHTLLPGLFNVTNNGNTLEAIELHRMLFNPFPLWTERGIDNALITAVNTAVAKVDRFFSVEITQRLFEDNQQPSPAICGLDLVSLNLQRGRDHGLPAYPVFRKHCNLPSVDTWEEMAEVMDSASVESIREIYDTPYDVDLYTGSLSEPPMEGAIFGPLLACIVSDQFLRLKKGDSHWYERKVGSQRFTKEQLHEIYNTKLAEIICRNSDSIKEIRKYVMDRRKETPNEYVECDKITFDFTAWAVDKQPQQLHSAAVSQALTLVHVLVPKKETEDITSIPIN